MKHIPSTALRCCIAVYLVVLPLAFVFRKHDDGWGFVLWLFFGGFVCGILWAVTVAILKLASIAGGVIEFVVISGVLGMIVGAALNIFFFGGYIGFWFAPYIVIVALIAAYRSGNVS